VFERFTERARQVVVLAQAEARARSHNYIGTEHILLGLLREEEGIAARGKAAVIYARQPIARFLLPGVVAAIGFPLGLLVGRLIWG